MKRDLVSFALWTGEDMRTIFDLTRRIKAGDLKPYTPLQQKSATMIFEEESLRTRVSFEVGIVQLGGHPIFLEEETIGIATRESVHDIGQVVSQYSELIIARTRRHQTCIQLAESATVPVINAMTELVHPCQILADAFTLLELKRLSPTTRIVFLGHGNNIANSWLEFAERVPLHLILSCPSGYEPHPQILEQAKASGASTIELIEDPVEAVKGADVIYTDVWPERHGGIDEGNCLGLFKPYQVNRSLLAHASKEAVFMHRLPAHRGEEVTSEVLDGTRSVALKQAENRLHVQKGIMGYLLQGARQ